MIVYNDDTELKSCPFCGGEPRLKQSNFKEWTITCEMCLVTVKREIEVELDLSKIELELPLAMEELEKDMIQRWNTRHYPVSHDNLDKSMVFGTMTRKQLLQKLETNNARGT